MATLKHKVIGAGLAALGATGLHRLARSWTRGLGAILTFHRVREQVNEVFAPNALLKITPAFLESLLTHVREEGYRLVSLDEVPALLGVSNPEPFLALTFDDGYRDTLVEALPVLERHAAPFTVFATTGFLDRTARLWWVELERALAKLATVDIEIGGRRYALPLGNPRQKGAAFGLLRRALLAGGDDDLLAATAKLCASADVDPRALVEELCLDWGELRRLLASPLAALGCHTRLTRALLCSRSTRCRPKWTRHGASWNPARAERSDTSATRTELRLPQDHVNTSPRQRSAMSPASPPGRVCCPPRMPRGRRRCHVSP